MERSDIVQFLNSYLDIEGFDDISLNGLQVEGSPEVTRVAFSPDACLSTFESCATEGCELLVVHHGLFWGKEFTITGIHAERFRCLFHAGINLYAAHLPLDYHPEVGNNAVLCRVLGINNACVAGPASGPRWFEGTLSQGMRRESFTDLVRDKVSRDLMVLPFGPDEVDRVAVCSGSAASLLPQVKAAGYNTFLTGESSHIAYHTAEELEINVIFAGHYATETFGLQALKQKIENAFSVETLFIDVPTHL